MRFLIEVIERVRAFVRMAMDARIALVLARLRETK